MAGGGSGPPASRSMTVVRSASRVTSTPASRRICRPRAWKVRTRTVPAGTPCGSSAASSRSRSSSAARRLKRHRAHGAGFGTGRDAPADARHQCRGLARPGRCDAQHRTRGCDRGRTLVGCQPGQRSCDRRDGDPRRTMSGRSRTYRHDRRWRLSRRSTWVTAMSWPVVPASRPMVVSVSPAVRRTATKHSGHLAFVARAPAAANLTSPLVTAAPYHQRDDPPDRERARTAARQPGRLPHEGRPGPRAVRGQGAEPPEPRAPVLAGEPLRARPRRCASSRPSTGSTTWNRR